LTVLPAKEFFVDPDIGRAESLKASAFVDPEFLELELNRVFSRSWTLVPHHGGPDHTEMLSDLLDKPGSRAPFSLLEKPFFLQRNSTGELSCFPNVCTHAWHPLVETPTVGGSIVCPQHGRRFDNDGKFVSHTGFENLKDFPRECDSLRKLEVESWGPFIFVCLGDPMGSFYEFVNNVQRSIPGIDLANLRYHTVSDELREVEGNWKQHAWNYMDNYHIRFVHKGPGGLADAIDLNSYRTELYQYSALQWAYARNSEHGFDPEHLATRFQDPEHPDKRVFALWWFIYPNLTFNFYPWGLSVNQYMPVLGKPDRTHFLWYQYSLNEEKFQHRNDTWLGQQVDAEDIEAISLVSKGAKSGLAPRGRFAPKEEAGPHWFHRLVYETTFEGQTAPQ
jgi:phenylpropionate dioxygenase-like ring-hydroxylating dioxygenase large terminal subunit